MFLIELLILMAIIHAISEWGIWGVVLIIIVIWALIKVDNN
jgi:hypothetical protein